MEKPLSEVTAATAQSVASVPLWTKNNRPVATQDIPSLKSNEWHDTCVRLCNSGARILALFVLKSAGESKPYRLVTVLANDTRGQLGLLATELTPGQPFPSLTVELPQAQAFEREVFECTGIVPEGHPWLKPLRRHAELEECAEPGHAAQHHPFFRVEGEGIHEVAVGPVHAGIIEPGHFRFQCLGEKVLSLEIQLGYQRRGAEALLLRSKALRRLAIAESIAGDTSVGHAMAYSAAVEALAGCEVPLAGQRIRGIALELERLANHVGDLGALCNDVGYLPGASWFGRLRGEFLNMLCTLSGNRFGRGLLRPGGVRFGLNAEQRGTLINWLSSIEKQVNEVAQLVFEAGPVCGRFEQTGPVTLATAEALGLVGPVARASGCSRDTRRDHAFGVYRFVHIPVSVSASGDVMARAFVRWLEAQRSTKFIREELEQLQDGLLVANLQAARPGALVVSMVETWRGEAVHVAVTGVEGELIDYRVVDPSFHNWFGLAMAMRNQPISDFPLCNKSFNLSYAGHDL